MRNEMNGISYLDRALNSAIMLAYIALGQGDNVSLMAFSNRIERFVRPVCYQGWPDALLPIELQDANPNRMPKRFQGQRNLLPAFGV